MKCKVCKNEVTKNPQLRNGTVRFVDDKGRLWNGKQCPDCYKEYNRARMQRTRNNPQAEVPENKAQ